MHSVANLAVQKELFNSSSACHHVFTCLLDLLIHLQGRTRHHHTSIELESLTLLAAGREIRVVCRAFLNLWFGKPMVCVRVAFHENDGNHENDENAKTTQTATNKEPSAGFTEITETTKFYRRWARTV